MAARPDRSSPAHRTSTRRSTVAPSHSHNAAFRSVRSGLSGRLSTFACTLLALGFASCASHPPPHPPSPAERAGRQAKILFIVPLNVALPMPSELESSALLVWRILVEHVESSGKRVVTLDVRTARTLWLESIRRVREEGGEESFESAARLFVQRLAKQVDFDALVMPSIYVQNARIGPEAAHWDRARQRMEFVGRSRWKIDPPGQSTIEAASILMPIFDSEGREIQSRRTGLELIQHFEIQTEKRRGHDKRTWVPARDDPPIEDENRVRAAIAHALRPFLPE